MALVLGLLQCRKPNTPTVNGGFSGVKKTITFTANGGDGSKSVIDNSIAGELGFKWEANDVLYVAHIRFDWAAKRILRDKANFCILEVSSACCRTRK